MNILEINNSKESAIIHSQWKKPGAKFYNYLLDSAYYANNSDNVDELINDPNNLNWHHYLKEAYLIAPIKDIKNSPYGRTPYSRSGCKYPHHKIKGSALVVDANGVKAAYNRARQMGIFKGDIKEHLMRHIEELGLDESMHIDVDNKIEENFQFIESFIETFNDAPFTEASHGLLKSSFRYGINIENGHKIKIVFDLKKSDSKFIGHDFGNGNSTIITDPKIVNNINKTGNNNFVSQSIVKAIVDEDTGMNLQSVKMIGLLNKYLNNMKEIINDYDHIWDLAKTERIFEAFQINTLKMRESIVKLPSWKPPKNSINEYNVGEKENTPSYKSTRAATRISDFINNMNSEHKIPNFNSRGVIKGREALITKFIKLSNEMKSIKNSINKITNKDDYEVASSLSIKFTNMLESIIDDLGNENDMNAMGRYGELDDIKNEIKKIINKYNSRASHNRINESIYDTMTESESIGDDLVPIFGLAKNYITASTRPDGTPIPPSSSQRFSKTIKRLTRGDNYSHALVSLDDTFKNMYSFEDDGFVIDNLWTDDGWDYTGSIYFTVMFVTSDARAKMQEFINYMIEHKDETSYADINLIKAFVGKPIKHDKRFVCSSFTGYILSLADSKNLHRDYSRLRPEDVTILPRAFYVMSVENREDFIKNYDEILSRVNRIYKEHKDELMDYNNHLPKLLLKEKMSKLKTIDKIINWVIDKF